MPVWASSAGQTLVPASAGTVYIYPLFLGRGVRNLISIPSTRVVLSSPICASYCQGLCALGGTSTLVCSIIAAPAPWASPARLCVQQPLCICGLCSWAQPVSCPTSLQARPVFCARAQPVFCARAQPVFCARAQPVFCARAQPVFCARAQPVSCATPICIHAQSPRCVPGCRRGVALLGAWHRRAASPAAAPAAAVCAAVDAEGDAGMWVAMVCVLGTGAQCSATMLCRLGSWSACRNCARRATKNLHLQIDVPANTGLMPRWTDHRPNCRRLEGVHEITHTYAHTHTHAPMTWERPGRKCAVRACIWIWDFGSTWMCGRIDHTPLKQPSIMIWKQGCAGMAQRSLRRASAWPLRCTLPPAHPPLCCNGVTATSSPTYTCSDASAVASASIAGRCNCPAPALAFLLLHRPPAIRDSFALPQNQHCYINGILAPPLFAAPIGAPLVGGDAACHSTK